MDINGLLMMASLPSQMDIISAKGKAEVAIANTMSEMTVQIAKGMKVPEELLRERERATMLSTLKQQYTDMKDIDKSIAEEILKKIKALYTKP